MYDSNKQLRYGENKYAYAPAFVTDGNTFARHSMHSQVVD
jgi:hypothetical protein